MSDIEQNKQIVRDFFTALGAYDFEAIMKIISQDVVFNVENVGCLGGKLTLSELPSVGTVLAETCPKGIRFEIRDLTAEENRVSCRVDGFAKTVNGEDYNNRYHFLLKIKDGKIIESFEYLDSLLIEKIFSSRVKN